jgi:thiol-disulfide isomerase/thioredoxin
MKSVIAAFNKIPGKLSNINMKRMIFIGYLLITTSSFAFAQHATINGKVNSLADGDTVLLTVNDVGDPFISNNIYYKAPISKKTFSFKIPVGKTPMHLSISYIARYNNDSDTSNKLNRLALDNYYLEAGDNLFISEDNENYKFHGKGASKFTVIHSLNAMQKRIITGIKWGDPSEVKLYFLKHDTLLMDRMPLIRSEKKFLSDNIFFLLKADALGDYLSRVEFINSMLPKSLISIATKNLKGYKSIVPKEMLNYKELDRHDITKLSSIYSLGIITRYKFDSCTYVNKPFSINKCYEFLLHHYSGTMIQRLLVSIIYIDKDSGDDLYGSVTKTIDLVNYAPFKKILNSLKSNRLAGADAYPFNLPDTSGKFHLLQEFKGKVILLDFWFTGCGICLRSAPFLKKIEEYFKGKPFVVISISLDNKIKVWKETIKTHKYTSENTVDLYTEEKNFYHPIVKHYFVEGCPTFILVDKAGKLMETPVNPIFDNGAQLTDLIGKALSN